jgi:hypothetical protein
MVAPELKKCWNCNHLFNIEYIKSKGEPQSIHVCSECGRPWSIEDLKKMEQWESDNNDNVYKHLKLKDIKSEMLNNKEKK